MPAVQLANEHELADGVGQEDEHELARELGPGIKFMS